MPDLPHLDPDLDDQRVLAECWLAGHVRRTKGRYPLSSYYLKHSVQRWCGRYVSSRAVAQATKALGFATVGQPTHTGNLALAVALRRPRPRRDGVR